jgi:ABC-type multidrug transport system ATPase subunit/pSer/pThr/pTyr-binding forkhead associated (FHA) protein/ABC-type multidrug transport system permease subunit
MPEEHQGEEDLVAIRATPPVKRRLQISIDDLSQSRHTIAFPDAGTTPPNGDFNLLPQSAALLSGDRRIPIPPNGLTLGSSAQATVHVGDRRLEGLQALIEATESGHVILEAGSGAQTYVNGELLVTGERRPLSRGDAIALGGELFHYLPAGEATRLAPVKPVHAGRLRSKRRGLTIGRDPACDLVLDHPTVSRRHAAITLRQQGWTIEDLGSSVGLRVNGLAVDRATLQVGDELAIGPYRIVFDGEDLFEREPSCGLAVVAAQVGVQAEGNTILQPTSLHLRAGELVAIIGESGAGKSTLLKALAGVSLPTQGSVLIGGEPVQSRRSELGYVPQFDIVHDQLTVTEALDFAARLRLPPDTAQAERTARVREVISQLGLEDRRDLRVCRLSGGQRKRVAVGVELLHRPGAMFLDEPTTGLDPGLEAHMSELFKSLASTGQTVVLVTHATASMHLYDRVIVMGRGGSLRFDGAPEALREAFAVERFDEVYRVLAEAGQDARQVPCPAEGEPPALAPPPLERQRLARPVQYSFEYQAKVLTSRYALLMLRDVKHLRSALVQVPILAILTAVLFTSRVFVRSPVTEFAGKSAQLIFLMVTIAIWLGSINAAREIVKERSVLERELSIGVQVPAYLASKLVVLFALAAVQIALFTFIVLALRPLHEPSSVQLELVIVLVLAGFISVLLGLLVSARASSEDQATGVIPLLLVPQLLFSGAMVQVKDMTAPVHLLSLLVPARWGFASAGHVIHMQERIDSDHVFSQISRYGQSFFSVTPVEFMLISWLFCGLLFVSITRVLQRSPR